MYARNILSIAVCNFLLTQKELSTTGADILYAFASGASEENLVRKKSSISGEVEISVLIKGELSGRTSGYYS